MKKILSCVATLIFSCFILSAQVMSAPGVENNLWTGFGVPLKGDAKYYGLIDCLQARVDVGQFTLEGMVNWGAIAYCDVLGDLDKFVIAKTDRNAFRYHYNYSENSVDRIAALKNRINTGLEPNNSLKWGQMLQDDYYVNFLCHPAKNFDIGMGTKLNWQVGPAPRYGAFLWQPEAHVRQGGFSTNYDDRHGTVSSYKFTPDAPGSADVVGFVPYANRYAKTAIGLRYFYEGDIKFQIGGAIPSETDTDNFRSNFGLGLGFENFNLAFAFEGLFQRDGNFYSGAQFSVKDFGFDVYFAWDSVDFDNGKDDPEDMSYSLGAAMTINFRKASITLIPEGCFNWFENKDYSPASYAGITFIWGLADNLKFSAYSSIAFGSYDKRWTDEDETEKWFGGNIFDLRPEISYRFNNKHRLSAYFDFENRVAFDHSAHQCWSTGAYWTYKYDTGSRKSNKKSK